MTVNHSSAIYVFDETGEIRLLLASIMTENPDIDGTAADLSRLVDEGNAQLLAMAPAANVSPRPISRRLGGPESRF